MISYKLVAKILLFTDYFSMVLISNLVSGFYIIRTVNKILLILAMIVG
jgi:hypothetical protein